MSASDTLAGGAHYAQKLSEALRGTKDHYPGPYPSFKQKSAEKGAHGLSGPATLHSEGDEGPLL